MKICHQCKKEIPSEIFVGRQTPCPWCRADLHCCLNCAHFEAGTYNDCRETQAERVLDKSRANFCEYFKYQETISGQTKEFLTKNKLEALFKQDK